MKIWRSWLTQVIWIDLWEINASFYFPWIIFNKLRKLIYKKNKLDNYLNTPIDLANSKSIYTLNQLIDLSFQTIYMKTFWRLSLSKNFRDYFFVCFGPRVAHLNSTIIATTRAISC